LIPLLYPFFIERLLLPGVGLLTGSAFWRLAGRMRRLERQPPEQIRRCQWESLAGLLRHAYEHVPLYRDRFAEAGLRPEDLRGFDDLIKLPPVTRQEVAANFPDRVTASSADPSLWRLAATSGTTSQRMIVVQDFAKRDAVRAAAAHSFRFRGLRLGSRYAELPPDVCNVHCGLNREPEPPLLRYLWRVGRRNWKDPEVRSNLRGMFERQVVYRQLVLAGFNVGGTCQPAALLDEYLARLRAYRPQMLKGLPAYLLLLARHIRRTGARTPRLREVRPMGSALAPAVRQVLADAFRCPVVEDYGSAELGSIGCECRAAEGLHLFSSLFFLEFVRAGRPVRPGEVGRVLVTDLTNRAMPLIRYDIGDIGYALPGEGCSCGRNTPRFRVLGRMNDTLIPPASGVLTEHQVSDFLYTYPGVDWFQLVQLATTRFDLQVVPQDGTPFFPETLSADLAAFLGGAVRVTVRQVKAIAPENGGKYRFLKSMSFSEFDANPVGATVAQDSLNPTAMRK
jgi:phenylacetate-CoA ligase